MTCAACSVTLTRLLSEVDGVSDVVVDLIGHSARLVVESQNLIPVVIEAVEDIGFDAEVVKVEPLVQVPNQETAIRTISLKVDGMDSE
jgi:copper chaperone CopZ